MCEVGSQQDNHLKRDLQFTPRVIRPKVILKMAPVLQGIGGGGGLGRWGILEISPKKLLISDTWVNSINSLW